jgi:UPF0176 protein
MENSLQRINTNQIVVCALYHFARIEDCESLQQSLLTLLIDQGIKGTVLVAAEGINGTVAGSRQAINLLQDYLIADGRFDRIKFKESASTEMPFLRTRVKLKQEIVTMGVSDIDPLKIVGSYIKPEDWNDLISDPNVTVIDTRNEYEAQIGTFSNAINPHTETFREFPDYVKNHLDPETDTKVAMFCTGGIRCEKSTAYLKSLGFDNVYHLEGGILNYLDKVPEAESLWQGECFVFDDRVTVDHNLEPGTFDQCHACRMPISDEDKASDAYTKGVSCPRCIHQKSDEDRARFQEREKQIQLAKQRGEDHIGSEARGAQLKHTAIKKRKRESQRLNRRS